MSRRDRFPQGSIQNCADKMRRRGYRRGRGFSLRRLSWHFYQVRTAAPAMLVLLLLAAIAMGVMKAIGG